MNKELQEKIELQDSQLQNLMAENQRLAGAVVMAKQTGCKAGSEGSMVNYGKEASLSEKVKSLTQENGRLNA